MARPPRVPLNPAQIDGLVQGFTTRMIHSLPADWQQLFITFRCVGDYVEMPVRIITIFGQAREWEPPTDTTEFFLRLRRGMYRKGEGTWSSAKYHLAHLSKVGIDYNWKEEPDWDMLPPATSFQRELELLPRDADHIPNWLAEKLPQTGTE